MNKIEFGDCREILKIWKDADVKIQMCVTSPPYYGLRDYGTANWVGGDPDCNHMRDTKVTSSCTTGHSAMDSAVGDAIYKSECKKCGAIREDQQIGLEETPEEYIQSMVEVFRGVRDILADDGVIWVNIGDSYYNYRQGTAFVKQSVAANKQDLPEFSPSRNNKLEGLKSKDLIGIPWMLAFALRADGWYLRQDIIWCLSGGTMVYVKSQKGIIPMSIKDLTRLDPSTVQLWNGDKWTKVLGWGESTDTDKKIEIVLRSGERIGCTGGHLWPTIEGNKKASELKVGDVIQTCQLPEPQNTIDPKFFTDDLLWLIGLYLAEGSRADDTVQLSLNADEVDWIPRITDAVNHVGGTVTHTISGNNLAVRMYGKVINAIIDDYIGGKTAKDKHFSNKLWQMSNENIKKIIIGYFDGDGHYDIPNDRVRLGFTRNYYLEQNLRTIAARLGCSLTLNLSTSKIGDKSYAAFKGEWRWNQSDHHNVKDRGEIVEIRGSRGRKFWDISVEDEPHLFALGSGVLTHNCKPNPMPESVRDRCTKSHEYIFLLSKSKNYYFDHEAIKEPVAAASTARMQRGVSDHHKNINGAPGQTPHTINQPRANGEITETSDLRNKRSVWTVATKPYKGAHFATYPEELIEPCILSSSRKGDIVFDPFMGSGTTAMVATKLGRQYLGTELNPEYAELQQERINSVSSYVAFNSLFDEVDNE